MYAEAIAMLTTLLKLASSNIRLIAITIAVISALMGILGKPRGVIACVVSYLALDTILQFLMYLEYLPRTHDLLDMTVHLDLILIVGVVSLAMPSIVKVLSKARAPKLPPEVKITNVPEETIGPSEKGSLLVSVLNLKDFRSWIRERLSSIRRESAILSLRLRQAEFSSLETSRIIGEGKIGGTRILIKSGFSDEEVRMLKEAKDENERAVVCYKSVLDELDSFPREEGSAVMVITGRSITRIVVLSWELLKRKVQEATSGPPSQE